MCLFFFSSRRRHTRLVSDWSSDVCSSDLDGRDPVFLQVPRRQTHGLVTHRSAGDEHDRVGGVLAAAPQERSEEHTSELQSLTNLVCRLLLEKKNTTAP